MVAFYIRRHGGKPINAWQIVHLTRHDDYALVERFERMVGAKGLPEYVERYVEDILGKPLKRRA
ncbi:MAG: hypothetical protein ACPGSB_06870 [Opitutales bacterium]